MINIKKSFHYYITHAQVISPLLPVINAIIKYLDKIRCQKYNILIYWNT